MSLLRWLPAVLWVGMLLLIFYFSSQAGSPENSARWLEAFLRWLAPDLAARLTSEQLLMLNFVLRKTGHATGYFVLTLLGYGAFRVSFGQARIVALRWAVATSLLRAVIDEIHQAFVPGRTGTIVDVGIDAVGIALAMWLVRCRWRRTADCEVLS
ncbi:MAG: VanZ family protein [Fimbriimonadales bacterium]|nr:VanZ family protein [Fimbriimonadales bacterium]